MPTDFYYPPTKNAIQKELSAQLLDSATTGAAITLDDVDGISNTPGVLVINRVDANGNATASKREYISYSGTSGSTVIIETRNVDSSGAARTHAVGSIVEFNPDVVQNKRMIDQFKVEHNANGTHNSDLLNIDQEHNTDGTHKDITADSITLASGATPTEFSTDGTLAGDSDTAIPTEKAVKTYVDAVNLTDSFRNAIRNPRFEIAQRGTGAFTSAGYTLDGWELTEGSGDSNSVTRESFTLGQTNVPGNPKYYLANAFTGGGGSTDYSIISQKIEGVNTFAGQEVTLSFYCNATTATEIGIEFVQNFGTGGSPSSASTGIGSTKKTITGTMTKYTVTATLDSITGKTLGTNGDDSLQVLFWMSAGSSFSARSGALGVQSGTIRLADVVLNKGSVAHPLQPRPLAVEQEINHRYLYTPDEGMYLPATVNTGTVAWFTMPLPTTMRATPTITGLTEATHMSVYSVANSIQTGFTFTLEDAKPNWIKIQGSKSSHGLTNPTLRTGATSSVISAEL